MVIVPNVHEVNLGFVNAFLIEEPSGLTLIDTGIPGCDKKIIAYIKSIGKSEKDIKRILLTHSDPDHIGALAVLKKLSGAEVYASAAEAEGIAKGKSTRQTKIKGFRGIMRKIMMSLMMRIKPVTVDKTLKNNDELPVLGGLVAIETFGHTPGHLSYYLKAHKLLFCGDSMNPAEGKITGKRPAHYIANAEQAAQSFKKQAAMKPAIVCFGHGTAIKEAEDKFAEN
jgi:glyoxylase-like metal-dependent hydrolase (beta-lactamase superfamily II)